MRGAGLVAAALAQIGGTTPEEIVDLVLADPSPPPLYCLTRYPFEGPFPSATAAVIFALAHHLDPTWELVESQPRGGAR